MYKILAAADTRASDDRDRLAVKRVWGFWAFFFVLIAILSSSGRKTVTPCYEDAAQHWLAGAPLYTMDGAGFIYLPHAAILHVPFVMLPKLASIILWRACTMGLFAAGVWHISRLARQEYGRELFPYITIVAVPLAWSSARNGQSTLAIAGLTMLAAHDLAMAKWNRATLWFLLGLALKPLIAVPLLLAGVMYRSMPGRLAVGLAALFAAPFLTQSAAYVWSQYAEVPQMLSIATAKGQEKYWAEPFSVLLVAGVDVPTEVKNVVRVVAAGLTLAACLWAARTYSPLRTGMLFYTLSACYIMLFNPRTENNTYSFVGPAVGLACAHAWFVLKDARRGVLLATIALGIVASFELGRLVTPRDQSIWLAPLMCSVFVAYVAWQMIAERPSRRALAVLELTPEAPASPAQHRTRRAA